MSNPQQQPNRKLQVLVTALVSSILALYLAGEVNLLGKIGKLIAIYGFGDLLLIQMRKAATDTAQRLNAFAIPQAVRMLDEATAAGSGAAESVEIPEATGLFTPRLSHAEVSAQAIRDDLISKLQSLTERITRFPDDVYKSLTADAAISQVLGLTPEAAQQKAYTDLMSKGITGFQDSAGRNWTLSAYVEMAVRTSAQRAFNASHLDRMLSLGIEYFTVSDDGAPCPLCAPWENKILGDGPLADATVAEATDAGLFHPNCKHVLVAYFPGVTKLAPPHTWSDADQEAYDDSQRQRAIERDIRAAKRQQAGAFTPEQKAVAAKKVRDQQARMRDFIDTTGRVRRSRREQLNLGNKAPLIGAFFMPKSPAWRR